MFFLNALVFGLWPGGSITAQLNTLSGGNAPWPYQNISQFISNIVTLAVIIAGVGSFALLLYGGIRYITSAGDKIGTQHAREVITAAIVGLVIVIGSYTIATTLGKVLGFNPISPTIPAAPRGTGGGGGATCLSDPSVCAGRATKPTYGPSCVTSWVCEPTSPHSEPGTGCLQRCSGGSCGWFPDDITATCCTSTGGCHP